MLVEHYRPLLDEWTIYDNTGEQPRPVVSQKDGVVIVTIQCGLRQLKP